MDKSGYEVKRLRHELAARDSRIASLVEEVSSAKNEIAVIQEAALQLELKHQV
jgi:hypothetical protein